MLLVTDTVFLLLFAERWYLMMCWSRSRVVLAQCVVSRGGRSVVSRGTMCSEYGGEV